MFKVSRVFKDQLVLVAEVHRELAHKAQPVYKAHKVFKVLTEYKDTLDKQVFKVLQVHKDILVFKVLLVILARTVIRAHKVFKV